MIQSNKDWGSKWNDWTSRNYFWILGFIKPQRQETEFLPNQHRHHQAQRISSTFRKLVSRKDREKLKKKKKIRETSHSEVHFFFLNNVFTKTDTQVYTKYTLSSHSYDTKTQEDPDSSSQVSGESMDGEAGWKAGKKNQNTPKCTHDVHEGKMLSLQRQRTRILQFPWNKSEQICRHEAPNTPLLSPLYLTGN